MTIKVRIKAKQTVTYDQVVEMDEEAFEKLAGEIAAADVISTLPYELSEKVEELLDNQLVLDAEQLQDVELERVP